MAKQSTRMSHAEWQKNMSMHKLPLDFRSQIIAVHIY